MNLLRPLQRLVISPRLHLLGLSCLVSLTIGASPLQAQVYVPYVPTIDGQRLDQDADILLEEARQLAQIPQQLSFAILRAKLATQLAPKNADAWGILGGLYLIDNQGNASVQALEKAKALAPREPVVFFRLGSAYSQIKDYPRAIKSLQEGLRIKPNVPSAMFDLGNAYFLNKQVPDAIAIYEKAYAQDPKFWFPLNNIGLIRYGEGRVDEAIRMWRDCVKIDGKEAEPMLALATALYVKKGDKAEGIKLASQAMKLNLRYSEPQYMRDNLWGETLIADTVKLLNDPMVKKAILDAQEAADQDPTIGIR
jgi:tetratricopeptide (TPR) repeat protein